MNRQAVRYLSEDQLIQKALETLMRTLAQWKQPVFYRWLVKDVSSRWPVTSYGNRP